MTTPRDARLDRNAEGSGVGPEGAQKTRRLYSKVALGTHSDTSPEHNTDSVNLA